MKGSSEPFSLINGVTTLGTGTGLYRIKTLPPTAIRMGVHENLSSLLQWHRVGDT